MSESPLDHAARALDEALRPEVSGLPPEVYRDAVKQVLLSIREPTEEIIQALGFVQQRHFTENPGARVWRDVIDILLDQP